MSVTQKVESKGTATWLAKVGKSDGIKVGNEEVGNEVGCGVICKVVGSRDGPKAGMAVGTKDVVDYATGDLVGGSVGM